MRLDLLPLAALAASALAACTQSSDYAQPPPPGLCQGDCSITTTLTWFDNGSTMALHLHRADDAVCSPQDCFDETCLPDADTVSWGATLILDADAGPAAPQRIQVPTPADGDYEADAWVAHGGNFNTHARMRIACGASQTAELTADLVEHEMWRAGLIHVADGACTVDAVTEAVVTPTCTAAGG